MTIPDSLLRDKYWRSILFLFQKHPKLAQLLTPKYFNFQQRQIDIIGLKRASRGWSQSEKFFLYLAIHLFNGRTKLDLNDMDYLDEHNLCLALEAIQLRYSA